jgi:L-lactate dehydrogenase complex protein LldG
MSSRDQILGRIRDNRPQLERPLPDVPLFDDPPRISLLAAFRASVERMGGLVLELGPAGDALAPVHAKLAKAKVIC